MQYPPSIRILVAEDNPTNQVLFTKMLFSLGYNADVVDDGMSALEACKAQPYDLIFMDYQMPIVNGIEAAKCIKGMMQMPKPVIVLMTANLLAHTEFLIYPDVLDDFLKKPFTIEEMAGVIEKWQPAFPVYQKAKKA